MLRGLRKYIHIVVLAALWSGFLIRRFNEDSSVLGPRDRRLKFTKQLEDAQYFDDVEVYMDNGVGSPTVHLVVAATAAENISWTSELKIPNLQVIQYVANDPSAPYHPPANKGHEAMMYHSYFYDFYEHLPDIAILTHAQDVSWHMDPLLSHSLVYALSCLDLREVRERGYTNLRVNWAGGCPAWINTTIREGSDLEFEDKATREAFLANFGSISKSRVEVPETLAQPCCSQFAVTRDTIRSVPRQQYANFVHWLLTASMDDYMIGRTWEHMFQWLFANKAVDCPIEWKAYCKMYHICFDGRKEYEEYISLDDARGVVIDRLDVGIMKTIWYWISGIRKKDLKEFRALSERIISLKEAAKARGKDEARRSISKEALYLDG